VHPQHHGRASSVRLSATHERWVIGTGTALLTTGALWLVFHYFITVRGDFGDTHHPLEAWWLRLHGAAAMASLVVVGTLLPGHVRRAWELRSNYRTGLAVLFVAAVLVLTGYALYYASSEELRPWLSGVHWVGGLVGLPVLVLHVLLGRRTGARRRQPHGHRLRGQAPTPKTRDRGDG
jgi:uncharacterized membrane protein YfcA